MSYILKGLVPANTDRNYVPRYNWRTSLLFVHSPLDCYSSIFGGQGLWASMPNIQLLMQVSHDVEKNLSSCPSPTPVSLIHPRTETQGLPAACKTPQQPVTMGCLSGEGAAPFLGAELSRGFRDASCASTAASLEPFMVHGESATRQSQRYQFPLLLAPVETPYALSCGVSYTDPGGCPFALCRHVCEGFAQQSLQTPSDIFVGR